MNKKYDVIIIGAGAAGLLCAIRAGERGLSVLLLEKTDKVGSKILISGGGRCNFSNKNINSSAYLSDNAHFVKSALSRFTQWDFIALMEKYGLTYNEKTLGQLFCEQKSESIVNMLLSELDNYDVNISLNQEISTIERLEDLTFKVNSNNSVLLAKALVIATGGASIPKIGASSFCLQIAKQFKIKNIPFIPALVPFTLENDFLLKFNSDLAGISHLVQVSCNKQSFVEQLLITHRGFSGPAILQISSYWDKNQKITINWFVGQESGWLLQQKQHNPKAKLSKILSQLVNKPMSKRLAEKIVTTYYEDKIIAEFGDKTLRKIEHELANFEIIPAGTEGMKKAEVCRGGVYSSEVSSKTFETNAVKNLYFIGEALNVAGWLGGYNLQWAWSSGWCCGDNI